MDQITTNRLRLTPYKTDDAEALTQIFNDPRVYRNTGTIAPGQTVAQTDAKHSARRAANLEGKGAEFSVFLDNTLIGMVGGSEASDGGCVDIGYSIAPAHWGCGFATEAATALLGYLVCTQQRAEITAGYFSDNPASGHILAKLGFYEIRRALTFSKGRQAKAECIYTRWPANALYIQTIKEAYHAKH